MPHPGGDPCHVDSESVICVRRARIVEEPQEKARLLNEFNRCFRPTADDIPAEKVRICVLVEIRLSEMTGRREKDRKTTYWRWTF